MSDQLNPRDIVDWVNPRQLDLEQDFIVLGLSDFYVDRFRGAQAKTSVRAIAKEFMGDSWAKDVLRTPQVSGVRLGILARALEDFGLIPVVD